MYQLQLLSLARLASTTSLTIQNVRSSHAIFNRPCDLHASTQFVLHPIHRQTIHTTPSLNKFFVTNFIPSDYLSKARETIHYHLIKKYICRGKAGLMYSRSCDSLDYIAFMKEFRMPDTFFSWFLITELHVWMMMVRLIAGGQAGIETRKHLVYAMWQDADARRKQLGKVSASAAAPEMKLLGYQFYAAIIGYDEGLMGNDQVLAGAVWRRILQSECNNPEHIEKLVIYIRKNINMMDSIPIDDFIKTAKVTFIDRGK